MRKMIVRLAQAIGFLVIFSVLGFFAYRTISANLQRQNYIEEVTNTDLGLIAPGTEQHQQLLQSRNP